MPRTLSIPRLTSLRCDVQKEQDLSQGRVSVLEREKHLQLAGENEWLAFGAVRGSLEAFRESNFLRVIREEESLEPGLNIEIVKVSWFESSLRGETIDHVFPTARRSNPKTG